MNKPFKPILYISLGAVSSLFIVYPLVIALLKYDRLNHSQSLADIILSSYTHFLRDVDFDMVLLVSIFLAVGGLVGYLFYFLRKTLSSREKRLSLEELLGEKESEILEFKSSLRWDYRQNKTNKELEFAVLKTIVAFMNSRNGTLIIGITDDASILGLEKDYQSLKNKNRDGFEQHIMELVSLNIGTDCCKNIRVYFFERDDHDICAIEVIAIKMPVFLKFQGNTLFYVRTGNHTRELNTQEAIKYINQRK